MKSLLLIRHAKSSWDFNVNDIDRPLNNRGGADAPAMAKRLIKREIKIDAFVSSPAVRAFTTAVYFAEAYGKKAKNIVVIPSLYEANQEVFFNVIEELDNEFDTVALFSHNPGITDFANTITSVKIDDMPTCAVFSCKINIKKWKRFRENEREFWFFEYPKSS